MADELATTETTEAPTESLAQTQYPDDQGQQEDATADTIGNAEGAEGEDAGEGQEADQQEAAPPVEPPHSWSAEDKETFKALPPEAQAVVRRREAERDRFVQDKANEVVRTCQAIETDARNILLQVTQNHAQQLQTYAQQFMPQQPDHRLLATGQEEHRALFYQQEAEYRSALAQQQQLQLQAEQAQHQATAIERAQLEAEKAEGEQVLAERLGPEWTDPSTRQKLLENLEPIGRELGYPVELMRQASATDILALKTAFGWREKAQKYDALQKAKMTNVRAAKDLPKVTQPGIAGGNRSTQPQSVAAMLYPND